MNRMMTLDEFLEHQGVKGMKWGVRKDAPPATPERVKAAEVKTAEFRNGVMERYGKSSAPISEAQFQAMSAAPVKLAPPGSLVKRIAGNSNLRDQTYISMSSEDHNNYKALLAPEGKLDAKKFEIDISVSSALVSPSKKERVQTVIDLMDANIPFGRGTVKGRAFLELEAGDRNLSSKALALKNYSIFAQNQTFYTPIHVAYFQAVKAKGYTALVDDADKGIVSNTPVIVFTQSAGAKVTGSRQISQDEIIEAQLNLTPPTKLSE